MIIVITLLLIIIPFYIYLKSLNLYNYLLNFNSFLFIKKIKFNNNFIFIKTNVYKLTFKNWIFKILIFF